MSDAGLPELKLAGFVRMTARGFALPCFAADARSNAWYTAICSVDADHAGQIAGFDVFQSDDIVRLPVELQRTLAVGSAWTDVFLWKDLVFVGTPAELWDSLESDRNEMLSAVPLTGLDLALSLPDQNVDAFIVSALEFMRSHFGAEHAETWKSETLVRQQLLIGLRRLSLEIGLGREIQAAIGSLDILPAAGNQLAVTLPPEVVDAFAKRNRTTELNSRLKETTDRLGIALIQPQNSETPPKSQLPIPVPETEPKTDDVAGDVGAPVRILIVVSGGKRARDVARHISYPEWEPDWLHERRIVLQITEDQLRTEEPPKKFVGGWHEDDDLFAGEYDVIVTLADDEILNSDNEARLQRVNRRPGKIELLAPALPEDMPSALLTGYPELSHRGFDALIDTSIARSPFWISNSRRALDRRIADIIVGAAVLCCGDSKLQDWFQHHDGSFGSDNLLTFSMNRGSLDARLALLSESSGAGDLIRWEDSFIARNLTARAEGITGGAVQISSGHSFFESFASAVFDNIGPANPRARSHKVMVPEELRQELKRPDLCAGFRLKTKRPEAVALCAEAPTLASVRIASSKGWAIVRYTDEESIKELVAARSRIQWPFLPRQIRLPHIPRREQNKGLATRGIDPRDIIRLTSDEWKVWKPRLPAVLQQDVRQYRTILYPSRSDDTNLEFVLPRRIVQQAVDAGRKRPKALLKYVDRRDRRDQRYPKGKRLADLRIAWSAPTDGVSRYILSDGIIPCEFTELDSGEVPAQRFFIIDGDAAVPALLGSRIFSVWARLTLRRSTSWMSRFSVSQTFETFPVLPPFLILHGEDRSVRLGLERGNRPIKNLCQQLRTSHHTQSHELAKKVQAEIDKAILSRLSLKENASDLQIFERLLNENRVSAN